MKLQSIQRTFKRQISVTGRSLDGDQVHMTLKPAKANAGIRFRRTDLGVEIPASIEFADSRRDLTLLRDEASVVSDVEHVLAALAGHGIDNAVVELSGPALPVLDRCSAPFNYLIQEAGIKKLAALRSYLKVVAPIEWATEGARLEVHPADDFKISYVSNGLTGTLDTRTLTVVENSFLDEIAAARDYTPHTGAIARYLGPAQFSPRLEGVVVGPLPYRYEDEAARHSILDLIGNFALLKYSLVGHVVAHVPTRGHQLAFVRRLSNDPSCLVRTSEELERSASVPALETPSVAESSIRVNIVKVVNVAPELLSMLRTDLAQIYSLDPDTFERLICDRLDRMEFDVFRTGSVYAPDGGIDIIASPRRAPLPYLLAVQAKHHRDPRRSTGAGSVREFGSAVEVGPFQAGMLVTSTTFSPSAKWAAAHKSKLLRLRDITDLSLWIADRFLDGEEWREIPSRIELGPGIFVDIPRPTDYRRVR